MSMQETIAAIATPTGRGGIGVIRLSGATVPEIAQHLLGRLPKPRYAHYTPFLDAQGDTLDAGIALYFPAPRSFTGEHVLELQGHGGAVILDDLLQRCLQVGARLARPGEFSERAFLNGKIDLVQAEAIADLIDSTSSQAARSAMQSLQGVFSQTIHQLVDAVTHLRIYIEAGIDFPDDEIDLLADGLVETKIQALAEQLKTILQQAKQGALLREGAKLVIVGAPNVGKSSLLNQLAGQDSAIVTEIAGTTRDILREHIHLDGIPLQIIDTAGLRETDDPVEKEGIRRAQAALKTADLLLLLCDDRDSEDPLMMLDSLPTCPYLIIRNKADLSQKTIGQVDAHSIRIAAKHGQGLDILKQQLRVLLGVQQQTEGLFMARRRHLDALNLAQTYIQQAVDEAHWQQGELVAEALRLAQQALGEITGKVSADDLLGKIFADFCIGK